jgi:hypothetical protein
MVPGIMQWMEMLIRTGIQDMLTVVQEKQVILQPVMQTM